jgi:hypothetical protein
MAGVQFPFGIPVLMRVGVTMPMVQIRVMRMPVPQPDMLMHVAMRFGSFQAGRVRMLVMRVVHVAVLMLQRLVAVLMFMPLRQMQP